MKPTLLLVLLQIVLLSFLSAQTTSLNLLSFNIRYDNPDDGENAWPNRKDKVANTILFHEADIIGMQEALKHQIKDLEKLLPKNFAWIGVGRTNGKQKGEYCPIFYNQEKYDVLEKGTFWLSKTPNEPGSVGWDAALPRIVTWVKFREKGLGKDFFVFNTHFDHKGHEARVESAKLLLLKINLIVGELPTFVTGDFNVEPTSEAYQILDRNLEDVSKTTLLPWWGSTTTFNGFILLPAYWKTIDYIFTKGIVEVKKAGTLSTSWEGKYASDHFPIFAKIHF